MSRLRGSKYLPHLVIGIVFLVAVAYVLTVLPGRSAPPLAAPSPSPSPHTDGLSDSAEGYLIRAVSLPSARGTALPVEFQILGPSGTPLLEYETVQDRQLHLYMIRDDISGYQHLHPLQQNGTWSTTVGLDDGGAYRFYAEFTPKGRDPQAHPLVLGLPFLIPGDTMLAPLPGPAPTSVAGAYTVTRQDGIAHLNVGRSALLRFDIPGAALEPYLGALAHMSAFEVRTQALTHLHPAMAELAFHTQFPNRGEYRLFLEFQATGKVHRATFTVFVT